MGTLIRAQVTAIDSGNRQLTVTTHAVLAGTLAADLPIVDQPASAP
jgi:hypothetical protein